jgi:tRNA U34 2-thiouridine synthase MnmA/TrmU
VIFDAPEDAVTRGQAAVFYVGDRVLGGAWIDRALAENDCVL